ncbi:MAG: ABC transporter ATP-binding protein, partial [Deltaproteobacteria bacterium]|nr:ABC transporter ATP-binding protein [Deltaproteobacteria bacterium]
EVKIDLPRPRWAVDVRADPRFAQLRTRIRELLRG